MAKPTYEQLVEGFRKAREAALAADAARPDDNDGGSSNFDSPAISVNKGMHRATLDRAAKEAGVELFSFSRFGRRAFWVECEWQGQGFRRTRMVEAATKALQTVLEGTDARVWTYYAVD
jgi:hypothetical protein